MMLRHRENLHHFSKTQFHTLQSVLQTNTVFMQTDSIIINKCVCVCMFATDYEPRNALGVHATFVLFDNS